MSDIQDFLDLMRKAKKEKMESPGHQLLEKLKEDIHATNPFLSKSPVLTDEEVVEVLDKVVTEETITEADEEQLDRLEELLAGVETPPQDHEVSTVELAAEFIKNEGMANVTKPEVPAVDYSKDIRAINDRFKHVESWLSRIASTGPGSGEVNMAFMEVPMAHVTSDTYLIRARDYYIGVNYAGAVTITLPANQKNGKVFIVKDELGEASKGTNRYITVIPSGSDTIDSRDRAILAYDYGSLTFVHKNGNWSVV